MANFNFNKAIIGGRITSEPELKTTNSGTMVTSFSVAVKRRGTKEDVSDFINVTAWQKAAELVCKYFGKGSSIVLEGTIQTRSYEDKNGNKRTVTEVIADQIYFVDSKSDGKPKDEPHFEEVKEDEELPF